MAQILNTHNEQEIIERLRGLPPQQLDEVIQFIDFVAERGRERTATCKVEGIRNSILDLRGRGKGEQLVKRLLRSRREDERHNERK